MSAEGTKEAMTPEKRYEIGLANQISAASPDASVWVAASAGSGKTRVLVDRTLRLMLEGTPPEKILCITFTKAAAAEMANRLNGELGKWSVMDDVGLRAALLKLTGSAVDERRLKTARELFARVLDAPGGLKIQTIHSFCESLLGRFPLEAGLAPHFEVMDERTSAELMQRARDRLLVAALEGAERAEPDGGEGGLPDGGEGGLADALARVGGQVNEKDFSDIFQQLASKRGALRRLIARHGGVDGLIGATRARLGLEPGASAPSVIEAACRDDAFDGAGLKRAMEGLMAGSATDRDRAALLDRWLAEPAARPDLLDAYMGVYLTNGGEVRARLATKKVLEADPGLPEILVTEAERLAEVQNRLKAVRVLDSTAALLRLGKALLDRYEREKAHAAKLDYDDLILFTRDLLTRDGSAPWVLYKLDGGLDHILVDEAQDTSPEQWEVVAALAEEFFAGASAREAERTLFVVGDEKQSIYSFQGANLAAFDVMREGFKARIQAADKIWREVPLSLSFRSTTVVLELVDRVFEGAEARQGLTAGGAWTDHQAFRGGDGGLVELWPVVKAVPSDPTDAWEPPVTQRLGDSPDQILASRIAGRIRDWLDGAEKLASKDRPIRPGDIMILVRRRRAFFDHMVRELKSAGVPVAGADRMVLTEQLAVLDLIKLGRFVLLPEDDLTLAEVLKGPLVGFSEDELFALAHGREGRLWDALRARRGERPVFAAAHDFLRGVLARADYVPVYEFYAELLGKGGARRKIVSRLGFEANDPIDEFLGLALAFQRGQPSSLQAFLHWVEAGEAQIKRDLEQGRDEVRVLTVHGAKGLQAPIVFLPDTCQVPQEGAPFLWLEEGEESYLLWPVRSANDEAACRAAREAAKAERMEEYRRLLYVALTRAEDRLYVCGWEGKRARAGGCWYDLVAAAFEGGGSREAALPWGETARRIEKEQAAAPRRGPGGEDGGLPLAPLPGWAAAAAPAEPSPPQPLTPSRPVAEEPAVRSPLGRDEGHRFRRGNLIHRLLQTLPDLPERDRAAAARRWLASPAHGLDPDRAVEIADETLRVLETPEFAPIFGPGSRAEVPLAGLVNDQALSGQVDRLLVAEDHVLVVDYKTNRPPPTRPEDVAPVYLRQMALYRAALRRIYPDREVRCALVWTDGPRLMALEDGLLDGALEGAAAK